MSNHRIKYETVSSIPPTKHRATCSCRGWGSGVHPTQQLVEDEAIKHLRNVEKARAAGSRSNPSLQSQAKFYAEQADNPDQSPEYRTLWRQLADELNRRCAGTGVRYEDVEIPFE